MKGRQSGQAMLEFFLAASFVLVPLFFLVTYLGKTGDVQHRAYEGARYAAWERAITNKGDTQISNEINKRILYGINRDIDSEKDRRDNNNDADQIDSLYKHTGDTGSYEDLLVSSDNSFVSQSIQNRRPDGSVHRRRSSVLNSGLVGYDLNEAGMLTASVEYELNSSRHLDLPGAIAPSARNTMYIETWRQISNDQVIDAMQGIVFGERAFDNKIFDAISTVAATIGFQAFEDFEPGFVRPDVVPCSRVIGGGGDREVACY